MRPYCSSTSAHSSRRPALAAVLDGVQAAVEPGVDRLALDLGDRLRRAAGRRAPRPPPRAASAPPRRSARARSCERRALRVELERVASEGRAASAVDWLPLDRQANMRLTTRSIDDGRDAMPGKLRRHRSSTSTRATSRVTLQPVERATMLPPAAFVDPAVLDWELDQHLPRLGLRRPRLRRRRAGQVPDARARHRQRRRHRRRGRRARAPSSTSAATAARGSSRSPRARSASGSSARTTPGPTTSTASSRAAPHMDGVEDFDLSCYGLLEVRARGRRRPAC